MKTTNRIYCLLLAAALLCLPPMSALATDNPSGGFIDVNTSIIGNNYGVVTDNCGTISSNQSGGVVVTNTSSIYHNYGSITKNTGSLDCNRSGGVVATNDSGGVILDNLLGGTVTANAGTVTDNFGTVTTNKSGGSVVNNLTSGTVATNALGGTVTSNSGTVTSNSGTVTTNQSGGSVANNLTGGMVTTNGLNCTVASNAGTIAENSGAVTSNTGTIDRNNWTGAVQSNAGTVGYNDGAVTSNLAGATITYNNENRTVGSNAGTITRNNGSVTNNLAGGLIGVVEYKGTVGANAGTINTIDLRGSVSSNTGTIRNAGGSVGTNAGAIENLAVGGTLTSNLSGGTVEVNRGTVSSNAGTVEENQRMITANSGTVLCNTEFGTIVTNTGVVHNYSGSVLNNQGTMYDYFAVLFNDAAHMTAVVTNPETGGSAPSSSFLWVQEGLGTVAITTDPGYSASINSGTATLARTATGYLLSNVGSLAHILISTAGDFNDGTLIYTINPDGTTVSVGDGTTMNNNGLVDPAFTGDLAIPETVTYNGVTYPVTGIGRYAFANPASAIPGKAIRVSAPSVRTVGERAFDWGHVTRISLPKATSIGEGAFANNLFAELSLPEATSVGALAVELCGSLTNLSLPKVTSLPTNAVDRCDPLTSIDLSSLTHISTGAFQELPLLTDITIATDTPPSVDPNAFAAVAGPVTVHVKPGTEDLWRAAAPWNNSAAGNPSFTILAIPSVAAPVIAPASGDFASTINAAISCATPGAIIRYTTDGSDPTASSAEYRAAVPVSAPTTLKARAFCAGMADSAVVSAAYTFAPEVSLTRGSAVFTVGAAEADAVFTIGAGLTGFNATNNYDHTELDGAALDASRVSAEDGSIILTFKRAYLNALTVGAHTARVVLKGAGFVGTTVDIPLTVSAAPVTALRITAQPADQSATVGQAAAFSVAAEGDGLTYQWFADDGGGWKPLAGATGARHAIAAVALSQNGCKYRCRVSDSHGQAFDSNAAALYVTKAPAPPVTGDSAAPGVWLSLFLLGATGLLALARKRRGA